MQRCVKLRDGGIRYGGAKGETNGIVAIMNMLKTDIENDITQADTDENEAAAAHTQLETDIDTTVSELQTSHGTLDGQARCRDVSIHGFLSKSTH